MSVNVPPAALCGRGAILIDPDETSATTHAFRAAFVMPLEERIGAIKPMIRYRNNRHVHDCCADNCRSFLASRQHRP